MDHIDTKLCQKSKMFFSVIESFKFKLNTYNSQLQSL
jgi:hypothetical protein